MNGSVMGVEGLSGSDGLYKDMAEGSVHREVAKAFQLFEESNESTAALLQSHLKDSKPCQRCMWPEHKDGRAVFAGGLFTIELDHEGQSRDTTCHNDYYATLPKSNREMDSSKPVKDSKSRATRRETTWI